MGCLRRLRERKRPRSEGNEQKSTNELISSESRGVLCFACVGDGCHDCRILISANLFGGIGRVAVTIYV